MLREEHWHAEGAPTTHREHSLTGRITLEALHRAFKAVQRNRGAAGLDTPSIKMCAANLDENLWALMRERKSAPSQPIPLRRVYLPQGKGAVRPLGIPAVRCRVAQAGLRALRTPIFAPTFHDRSPGCRRHRSCHTAMAQRVELHQHGYRVVVEADLQGCCASIPHPLLLDLVACEIADGNILRLVTQCLRAGVMEEGEVRPTRQGAPQGGGRSPRLANLVLHPLEGHLEAQGYKFVRSADDCVVLGKTTRPADKALPAGTGGVEERGLALNLEQTHLTTCGQGFAFLGYHVTARTSRRGGKAEERFQRKSKMLTRRRHNLAAAVVMQVNRVIRGTVRYFATAFTTCRGQFNELDRWIRRRIRCMKEQRIGKTDNRRLQRRHIRRMGFVLCRETDLSAK